MDAVAVEIGRNPVSKHHVQPEGTDAGRDGQTRLARPNSQARTRIGKYFLVQLTTSRIGNLTWLTHNLLHVMTLYTYICSEGLGAF